jgi:hypothetical protein
MRARLAMVNSLSTSATVGTVAESIADGHPFAVSLIAVPGLWPGG